MLLPQGVGDHYLLLVPQRSYNDAWVFFKTLYLETLRFFLFFRYNDAGVFFFKTLTVSVRISTSNSSSSIRANKAAIVGSIASFFRFRYFFSAEFIPLSPSFE